MYIISLYIVSANYTQQLTELFVYELTTNHFTAIRCNSECIAHDKGSNYKATSSYSTS